MTLQTQTVFDVDLTAGDIGNMTGRTPRMIFDLSGYNAPDGITRFRITMQGSANEPYAINKLYGGQDGNLVPVTVGGAVGFTIPQNGQLVSDWIEFTALPDTFSMYINGGTGNDRIAGLLGGTPHTFWLKSAGDYATQSGLSGFVQYSGYHGLVTKLEIEYDDEYVPEAQFPFRRYLMGCEPERVDKDTLRVMQGSWAEGVATADEIYSHGQFDIDLTTTGLNALDVGSMVTNQDYFIYLVRNPVTKNIGAVVSASIIYSGVTKPAGYTQIRKLPWGFVWKGSTRGAEPFHISGWPLPFIRYTYAKQDSDWAILTNGTATSETTFSCAAFVPDNARMVYVGVSVSGSGSAYIGTFSGELFEVKDGAFVHVRCNSARELRYRVTGSAQLTLHVFGYTQTERS